jgi:uncharacterized protein YjbJ (UPF0337 family)
MSSPAPLPDPRRPVGGLHQKAKTDLSPSLVIYDPGKAINKRQAIQGKEFPVLLRLVHVRMLFPGPGIASVPTPLHEQGLRASTGRPGARRPTGAHRAKHISTMDTVKKPEQAGTFKIAPNTWGAVKTKLKNKFTQLTDADLAFQEGKEKELSSRLQARLNKSEAEVNKLITTL